MKPYLLAFTCLLVLSANSQNKDVIFKRIDSILQRTNGYKDPKMSIIKQEFSEKFIKLDGADEKGERSVGEFSGMQWKGMEFELESLESLKGLIKVSISLDKEVSFKTYAKGKKVDEEEMDEVIFFVKEADKEAIRKELGQLTIYTWPELISITKMDKQALLKFIQKNLDKAGEEYNITVKSINECEIVFKEDNTETTVPTKIREIHLQSGGDDYNLCYGKAKAQFTIREGNKVEKETDEHPDVDLVFEKDYEQFFPVEFALKQLAKMCQR